MNPVSAMSDATKAPSLLNTVVAPLTDWMPATDFAFMFDGRKGIRYVQGSILRYLIRVEYGFQSNQDRRVKNRLPTGQVWKGEEPSFSHFCFYLCIWLTIEN